VPDLTTTRALLVAPLPSLDPFYPPGASFSIGLVSLLTAWGLSEILRYGFFALKEAVGSSRMPYAATWLRYSGFLPLYPLGVSSELWVAYVALPAIASRGLGSVRMPNAANWAFDYSWACGLAMLAYLPGLPVLYGHMLTQRKKALGGGGAKAAAAAGAGGRKKRA